MWVQRAEEMQREKETKKSSVGMRRAHEDITECTAGCLSS